MKYVKKLQCITLCLLLTLCLCSGVAAKTSKRTKALKAYQTFLAKGKFWAGDVDNGLPVKFKAVDLNNDKVPELLVENQNYSLADGLFGYYAYVSGKVKFIHLSDAIEYSSDTRVYVKGKRGYIYDRYERFGNIEDNWYTYNGKKVTLSYSYEYNDYTGKKTYRKGSKKITKSAYDKAVKNMKKRAKIVKFTSMHTNTAYNRKKYLK